MNFKEGKVVSVSALKLTPVVQKCEGYIEFLLNSVLLTHGSHSFCSTKELTLMLKITGSGAFKDFRMCEYNDESSFLGKINLVVVHR